mmetsp:Transcript_21038/g.63240  ORF Transcript_21038/g.63240 Transcript_21038/m.63240 type:complete len:258 (+) Transcript_21038:1853-2626(+)
MLQVDDAELAQRKQRRLETSAGRPQSQGPCNLVYAIHHLSQTWCSLMDVVDPGDWSWRVADDLLPRRGPGRSGPSTGCRARAAAGGARAASVILGGPRPNGGGRGLPAALRMRSIHGRKDGAWTGTGDRARGRAVDGSVLLQLRLAQVDDGRRQGALLDGLISVHGGAAGHPARPSLAAAVALALPPAFASTSGRASRSLGAALRSVKGGLHTVCLFAQRRPVQRLLVGRRGGGDGVAGPLLLPRPPRGQTRGAHQP